MTRFSLKLVLSCSLQTARNRLPGSKSVWSPRISHGLELLFWVRSAFFLFQRCMHRCNVAVTRPSSPYTNVWQAAWLFVCSLTRTSVGSPTHPPRPSPVALSTCSVALQSLTNSWKRNKVMQDRPQQLQVFTLCLRQYVYSAESKSFEAVPGMPTHLPAQVCAAVDALRLIASGI